MTCLPNKVLSEMLTAPACRPDFMGSKFMVMEQEWLGARVVWAAQVVELASE
jgi:hypothetical protein